MDVLIADDDPVSRKLLQARLEKWGYGVIAVDDGEAALEVLLGDDAPRMAILDWMMPKTDGLEVCRRIRLQKPKPYTYTVLLTAKGNTADLVAGMRAGADDYVVKPFNVHELQVRIRAGRRQIDLQSELMEARDALRFQATHDPLTGILNRAAVIEILERQLSRAFREESDLAVIMTDIDHFKRVNDEFGHIAGDAVLREVARKMKASVRSYDEVGRYGGEEFLIVTPCNSSEKAAEIAERVRTVLAEAPVATSEGVVSVAASFGVSGSETGKDVDADAMIRAADAALYRAKAAGRNCVEQAVADDFKPRGTDG